MKLPLERHTIEGLFNIDSEHNSLEVCMDYDVEELEKVYEEIKQKYDETLKMLQDKKETSITWTVEDFIYRAFQKEYDDFNDFMKMDNINNTSIEDAKKYLKKYDADKFEDALYDMIRHHDAEIGITWDTIDTYLDNDCLKDKTI